MGIISPNILAIIMCIAAIVLVCFNKKLYNHNIVFFIVTVSINIIMLAVEIIDHYFSLGSPETINLRIAINTIGIIVAPLIAYFLILFNMPSPKKHIKRILIMLIPEIIYLALCLINIKTGWIFTVSTANVYTPGSLYIITFVVFFIYIVLIFLEVEHKRDDYSADEMIFLFIILFVGMMAFVIQMLFTDLYLLWSTAALFCLLYYIILREMQYKYDPMTGMKNRATFDREMLHAEKDGEEIAIVVLDVNELKSINDNFGHLEGDSAIVSVCNIIQEIFNSYGSCYRIGGDEFTVICREIKEDELKLALKRLQLLLDGLNKDRNNIICLAYGYQYHQANTDIYDTFKIADFNMYECKKYLKEKKMQK